VNVKITAMIVASIHQAKNVIDPFVYQKSGFKKSVKLVFEKYVLA
jgi:hypothetical protein